MKKALGPVTLAYPMPAFLVAAYDEEGKANIMTAAWGGICCSNPPCIAVSVRPERWTHKAIVARKAFTVCVPSARRQCGEQPRNTRQRQARGSSVTSTFLSADPGAGGLSRSVTVRRFLRSKMLQIEIEAGERFFCLDL